MTTVPLFNGKKYPVPLGPFCRGPAVLAAFIKIDANAGIINSWNKNTFTNFSAHTHTTHTHTYLHTHIFGFKSLTDIFRVNQRRFEQNCTTHSNPIIVALSKVELEPK